MSWDTNVCVCVWAGHATCREIVRRRGAAYSRCSLSRRHDLLLSNVVMWLLAALSSRAEITAEGDDDGMGYGYQITFVASLVGAYSQCGTACGVGRAAARCLRKCVCRSKALAISCRN